MSHPDCCPLCSQPLAGNSNTCPSCGFTAHEPVRDPASPARPFSPARASKQPDPITPIPARASAQRPQSSPGRPSRRSASSASSRPPDSSVGQRARNWQHNSPNYEAASSLSSLSLIISETPTAPPRSATAGTRATGRLEHIDEIDTVPPPPPAPARAVPSDSAEAPIPPGSLSLSLTERDAPGLALILSGEALPVPLSHIDEIDTVPAPGETSSRALQLVRPEPRELAVNAASWTASSGSATSLAAQFIASRSRRRKYPRGFNLLDRARWWLLRPGRIEFLLWLAGSFILFGITFLLLLATVLSLMLPGLRAGGKFPNSATSGSPGSPTSVVTPAISSRLHLALIGKPLLSPGAELSLQGQGFHSRSQVVFLLDGRWPLLDQSGRAAATVADASGRFTINLWLGQGSAWSAGRHQILARERGAGSQVSISITITSSSTTPVSSNPVPPVYPTPTPVRPTPIPTPVRPTPTPTHAPTPTPTPGISPTPTPRGTATPARTSTASQGKAANSSSLGNSLNDNNDSSLFARLAHLNPLVWVIGVCYSLSMLLLGMAGILRRRRR